MSPRPIGTPTIGGLRGLDNPGLIEMAARVRCDIIEMIHAADETGATVTAENKTHYGGLGGAVAGLLVEHEPVPMRGVGVADTFARSGPYLPLIGKYGLSARHTVAAVREARAH